MERRCGCIVGKVCSGDESFKLGVMVMVGDGVGIGVGSHQSSSVSKGVGSHHWSDIDECCLTVFMLAVAVTAGGCCILQPMKLLLLLSLS